MPENRSISEPMAPPAPLSPAMLIAADPPPARAEEKRREPELLREEVLAAFAYNTPLIV